MTILPLFEKHFMKRHIFLFLYTYVVWTKKSLSFGYSPFLGHIFIFKEFAKILQYLHGKNEAKNECFCMSGLLLPVFLIIQMHTKDGQNWSFWCSTFMVLFVLWEKLVLILNNLLMSKKNVKKSEKVAKL